MTEQICRTCQTARPLEDFPLRRKGSVLRRSECSPCSVERARLRREAQRAGIIPARKQGEYELTGETKICGRCEEEFDIALFDRDKNKKDGRHTYCKKCRAEHNHQYILGAGREHSFA